MVEESPVPSPPQEQPSERPPVLAAETEIECAAERENELIFVQVGLLREHRLKSMLLSRRSYDLSRS